MNNRAGLRKVVKTVKGKKGTVRRSYWVKSGQQAKRGQRTMRGQQPQKEGFLKRHAGKLALGAALLGVAALNRHKLAGAARGAGLALNAHKHHELAGGSKASAVEKARDAFRGAKLGFNSNRGMDRIDHAGKHITAWRRSTGAGLAAHLAKAGGGALAEHAGSRIGQYAGGAIGGLFGGPLGASVGSFVGQQAGGYLAGAHAEKHVKNAAERLASRLRR